MAIVSSVRGKSQAQMMREKGYMHAGEVARRAGVSSAAVHGWADKGQVESVKVGKRCYLKIDSLVRHLGEQASVILNMEGKGP